MRGAIFRSAVLTVAWALAPSFARAQAPPTAQPQGPAWDVAFLAGSFNAHGSVPDQASYHDSWFNTGLAGLVLGRHWGWHVKTEVEFAASGEGRRFVERSIRLPNYPNPVFYGSEEYTSVREGAATVTWQFFENQWVHPFVQAGIAVDLERRRSYTWPNTFYSGDPRLPGTQVVRIPEGRDGPAHRTTARALVGAGAKFYVTPRVFVRTDARGAFGSRFEHLSLRAGLGVDF